MEETFCTKRLYFKQLKSYDKYDYFNITGDPEVMKYWIGGADKSVEESELRIIEISNHWEKYGFGDWGIFEKESKELIGFGGTTLYPEYGRHKYRLRF